MSRQIESFFFWDNVLFEIVSTYFGFFYWIVLFYFARLGERPLLLSGYTLMLAGFIFYLPWGPGYPKIRLEGISFLLYLAKYVRYIVSLENF